MRRSLVAAAVFPRARDMGGAASALHVTCHVTHCYCLQVYLLFDNIELFLIFAGDQLGKLKVICTIPALSRHF